MATVNFEVEYSQSANPNESGVITYNSEQISTDGRLDVVGQSTTATGFTAPEVPNCSSVSLSVTCTRTSDSAMSVLVTISASCGDSYGYGGYGGGSSYGYGYGYGYGGSTVTFERLIEDVELNL